MSTYENDEGDSDSPDILVAFDGPTTEIPLRECTETQGIVPESGRQRTPTLIHSLVPITRHLSLFSIDEFFPSLLQATSAAFKRENGSEKRHRPWSNRTKPSITCATAALRSHVSVLHQTARVACWLQLAIAVADDTRDLASS